MVHRTIHERRIWTKIRLLGAIDVYLTDDCCISQIQAGRAEHCLAASATGLPAGEPHMPGSHMQDPHMPGSHMLGSHLLEEATCQTDTDR